MLGNGVKRKLDEDEDGLEEHRGLAGDGGAGGLSQASYTLQRQTVLNMSVMKLYSPRTGADLGLRRRVLINNVVRRIHDDFRQEGGMGAFFFSVPSTVPAAAQEEESCRQPPPPPPSFGVLSSPLSALDSCLTPASLLEDDLPLFFTLPPSSSSSHHHLHHSLRPPLPPPSPSLSPKDSFSSALEEIEELCPPSSPLQLMVKEEARGSLEEESWLYKLRLPPPSLPSLPPLPPARLSAADAPPSTPGSFLTDFALDDVLFTDIDTSMYDFGPCPAPSGAAPSKMADELVRSMSSYSTAAGASGQNQPFKMDLAELDHIMEVLVGS